MSILSVVEERTRPEDAVTGTRRTGAHPVVLGTGSALLLWSIFPPADWGWLAWIALTPLFLMIPSQRSRRSLYLGSWVGGMVFWTLAVQWVRLTDESAWLAWLSMALALSLFWPAFLLLARIAVLRLGLPLMIAAPVVWVALEYGRAFILSGFPWYYLAHSQHSTLPVIQIADLTGSLGVSFVIAVVNAWFADLIRLPLLRPTPQGARLSRPQLVRLGSVVLLLGATLGYGAIRLGTSQFRDGPRVALLQSSMVQQLNAKMTAHEIENRFIALIDKAVAKAPLPDLIVWPETAFPFSYTVIDPKVDDRELDEQLKRFAPNFDAAAWRQRTKDVGEVIHQLTDRARVPMLFGTLTYDHRPTGLWKYNSAALFEPANATPQSYHKLHLVPFGEYVPLIDALPWMRVFLPFGPNAALPSLNFGEHPTVLNLGSYRIATAICFEDTVPHVVRRFFHNPADGKSPDVLLNLSNDGWFKDSWEQETHLAVSVFRAVENRVPLARAANTGVSAIVDGDGRVLEKLRTLQEGVVSGIVPLDDRDSLYSAWGDWLGMGCVAITIGVVVIATGQKLVRR